MSIPFPICRAVAALNRDSARPAMFGITVHDRPSAQTGAFP
jgi:hypothetical protein